MNAPLRIGVLGAARITPKALIHPARQLQEVSVTALAARDVDKARGFARRYNIPRVHTSYADLIADPEIDAIYNPLPNSHHGLWSIRAMQAGKDVLCEKPLAANMAEAQQMAQVAQSEGRVLMEAFHYRYHPLMTRALAILQTGELGAIRHIEASFCAPMWRPWDIRWRWDLAGGSLMDMGCYAVHMVRTLAGAEPEVIRARAWTVGKNVDRCMEAELAFPDGPRARVSSAFISRKLVQIYFTVQGERGWLRVINPVLPHLFHRLTVEVDGESRTEQIPGSATYFYQLARFADAVRTRSPFPTNPADAIANMRVIDAIYAQAGLPLRQPFNSN